MDNGILQTITKAQLNRKYSNRHGNTQHWIKTVVNKKIPFTVDAFPGDTGVCNYPESFVNSSIAH